MYGDLMMADGQYGGSKGRRWKVDWNRTPQPIQVKLKCLRGVKDKLPGAQPNEPHEPHEQRSAVVGPGGDVITGPLDMTQGRGSRKDIRSG